MKPAIGLSLLLVLETLTTAACSANPTRSGAWISTLIARFEAAAPANPPHRILRYRQGGQHVYYVPPSCCDQPGTLYDDNGQVICHPDGGFSGKGDGRCPDFHARKSEPTLIWSDPRAEAKDPGDADEDVPGARRHR